jgi:SH3-like domain-containing protein
MRFLLLPLIFLSFTAQAATTHTSGLKIPRFVVLKNTETNIRSGPGTRYPIAWVFRREHMPVEVVDEFDLWRKIRDMEGTTGWVHRSMIDGKRYAMITGKQPQILRADASEDARAVIKAEPTVIAPLKECTPSWCRIQVEGRKAWIEKKHLWGVYKEEVFD